MNRVFFNNNKIVEALCQFTFTSAQDNTILGQYWDLLQKEDIYTEKENLQGISFAIIGNQPSVTPALANSMKYFNAEKDKIIQLHNNNISIHQIKKYQKWELFKTDIGNALSKFNQVASKSDIERIDLRTINIFDFPSDGFELSDYFNVFTHQPEKIKSTTTNIILECPLDSPNTFVVLRLNMLIVESKANVVLDLSFVSMQTNIPANDTEQVYAILEKGHTELYNLFSSVITDKTKDIIK